MGCIVRQPATQQEQKGEHYMLSLVLRTAMPRTGRRSTIFVII